MDFLRYNQIQKSYLNFKQKNSAEVWMYMFKSIYKQNTKFNL